MNQIQVAAPPQDSSKYLSQGMNDHGSRGSSHQFSKMQASNVQHYNVQQHVQIQHHSSSTTVSTHSQSAQNFQQQQQQLQNNSAAQARTYKKRNHYNPSLSEIEPLYHLPLEQAAATLNICPSKLKKLCREYGVKRWPYRKQNHMKSVESRIQELVSSSMSSGSNSNSPEMFQRRYSVSNESMQQIPAHYQQTPQPAQRVPSPAHSHHFGNAKYPSSQPIPMQQHISQAPPGRPYEQVEPVGYGYGNGYHNNQQQQPSVQTVSQPATSNIHYHPYRRNTFVSEQTFPSHNQHSQNRGVRNDHSTSSSPNSTIPPPVASSAIAPPAPSIQPAVVEKPISFVEQVLSSMRPTAAPIANMGTKFPDYYKYIMELPTFTVPFSEIKLKDLTAAGMSNPLAADTTQTMQKERAPSPTITDQHPAIIKKESLL